MTPRTRKTEIEVTNHSVTHIADDHAYPLLVFAVALLALMVAWEIVSRVGPLLFCCCRSEEGKLGRRVAESELDTYDESLFAYDVEVLVAEERHAR